MGLIFIPRVVISSSSETDDLVNKVKESISSQPFKDFILFVQSIAPD